MMRTERGKAGTGKSATITHMVAVVSPTPATMFRRSQMLVYRQIPWYSWNGTNVIALRATSTGSTVSHAT